MSIVDWFRPLVNFASQHGRRANVANGRAHVELRALDSAQCRRFAERLGDALTLLEGAGRATVNEPLGRAIVELDADVCDLARLLKVVDRVEHELGLDTLPFSSARPEHPGDLEPLVRCLIELGGDVTGIGLAMVGRLARLPTLPIEVDALALLALFDAPRLREAVEERIGRQTTSFLLTLSNAMTQGMAQSVLGPVVDAAYHGIVLAERVARRSAWVEREPELCGHDAGAASAQAETPMRPVPLPDGPVEKYADVALVGSGAAFAVGLAVTGRIAEATPPLLSLLPKPARLGRDAFAEYLGFALARRGAITLDRRALRRLDRVSCLVLPLELLVAADVLPGSFVAVDAADAPSLRDRIATLLDPCRLSDGTRDGEWSLAPLDRDVAAPAGYRLLALRRGDCVVAVVRAQAIVDPEAEALLDAARSASVRIVVAVPVPIAVSGLTADEIVPGGPRLAEQIRRLQRDGHVVCMVAGDDDAALPVADYGIGIVRARRAVPWSAHVVCSTRDDARFVVEACRTARVVSSQSVQLATISAGLGGILSLGGLTRATALQVSTAVNVASLAAIANGVRLGIALASRRAPVPRDATPWHALDGAATLDRLESSLDGLASAEASKRVVHGDGPPGTLARMADAAVEQLRNPLTPLLAVGAGLSAAAGSVIDAGMVAAVLVVNACTGAVQRVRTEWAIDGLAAESPRRVRVRRDGEARQIDASALVPGDVVLLGAGESVPADCRLLGADDLEVDESSLTGESLPVAKTVRASRSPAVAERSSMLYEGTSVVAGSALAVVVAVGDQTEARSAARTARGRKPREGVETRLESLTSVMVPAAVFGGLGVAAVGLLRGQPGREVLGAGTGLAVAAVPEGLPLLALAAQLAAARRLSLRGTLVRNPRTIEALGRVNVVCFDKTGTVTEGRLHLRTIWEAGREQRAEPDAARTATLPAALRATPVAPDGDVLPHLTDQALATGALVCGVAREDGQPGWVRLAELPFEAGRGYHAVLGRVGDRLLVSVKGAPEIVLARCTTWRGPDGRTTALDSDRRMLLADAANRMAGAGLRVLGVAERDRPLDVAFDDQGVAALVFEGFVGFSDPVRQTAGAALHGLRDAGVSALLVTGDHPGTAARIATELGLAGGPVVTGPDLDDLDDDAVAACIIETRVFARMTPAHKVRLVAALQRAGKVVAMTGDGANDAAAIRLANVGIALGARAGAAANEAADIVITDDRMETIVDAVLEGRAMWTSVRDAVAVLVGGNVGELGFGLVAGLLGDTALNARQLLLVNLLTDIAPAMAIAVRPPRALAAKALLHEGPEASLAGRLTADIAWRGALTGGAAILAWSATRARGARTQTGTAALIALVATQLGQTVATDWRSPLVVATSAGSLAALAGIVQTPGLSQLFGCTPLGPLGWATALGAAGAATGAALVVPRVWPELGTWLDAASGARARGAVRQVLHALGIETSIAPAETSAGTIV